MLCLAFQDNLTTIYTMISVRTAFWVPEVDFKMEFWNTSHLLVQYSVCVCVCLYKSRSFYNVFFCNVLNFNIQLSILQDAQGVEERETLARMAANVENTASADSEAYIEKYLRSVLAVENLLTLDRLRQVSQQSW